MVLEAEHGSQVAEQQLLVSVLSDGIKHLLVHSDLVLLALITDSVLLLLGVKDLSLSVTGLLELLATEVLVIDAFGDPNTRDINRCLSGNNVDLVDAAEGASI